MTDITYKLRSLTWPVWRDSLGVNKVKFIPYPKLKVVRWYHLGLRRLTAWETQRCATKANGRRTAAHTAKLVLHTLIFDFYNFRSGRLDPSYEAIAKKAGVARATVARGLTLLRRLGILDWIRRCVGHSDGDGRFQLQQETNAYHLVPPTQWAEPMQVDPPPPRREAWGAAEPHPDLLELMAALSALGSDDPPEVIDARAAVLEREPLENTIAHMKARNLRRMAAEKRNSLPRRQNH